jgi:6-phosphogluconolactonase
VIELFEDKDALSQAAAEFFALRARTAVAARGRFLALLSGGETPRQTYELLAQEPHRTRIPWQQVHFFWGDERCVPAEDPRRNEVMAHRSFLDALPLRPEQLHPIVCEGSPRQAAESYDAHVRDFFAGGLPRFDFIFLGLGEDGHTASLLPDSEALNEQVCWTAVTRRPEDEFSRVTLTAPLLNQAAAVVFLVTGRNKAKVLRSMLEKTGHRLLLPAQLIRPLRGDLCWFVDREAACLLDV